MSSLLEQTNIDWHSHLHQLFNQFLYDLTELDLNKANDTWRHYKTALQQHITFEDEFITPLGAGIEGNQQTLIAADHKILQRLITRIDPALEELNQSDSPRQTMVEQLDGYLKMRNVLTHHDLREVHEFYPALEALCSAEKLSKAGEKMTQLLLDLVSKSAPS